LGFQVVSNLTREEKYNLFLNHVTIHKSVPGNPDWVGIYEHLEELQKIDPIAEWNTFHYSKKIKYAMAAVVGWVHKNYTIMA
jgi:hypothetical protein